MTEQTAARRARHQPKRQPDGNQDGQPHRPPAPRLPPLPTRRKTTRTDRRRSAWRLAAMSTLVVAYLVFVWLALTPPGGDVPTAGLLAFPVMVAALSRLTQSAVRAEQRFDLRSIILVAVALRGIGACARYSDPVDALVYHREGVRLAPSFRSFELWPDTGRAIPGTGWIRYISGVIHALVFDDMMTTFLVFTSLAFIGTFLCYRAFVHAVPEGDHKRYALLIFFWPSLLFWPSSIGKEAWMLFGLGVVSWGVSRLVTHRIVVGAIVLNIGMVLMGLTRPHIALMVVAAVGVALLARSPSRASSVKLIGRVISIFLLIVGGAILAGKTADVLQLDNTGAEGIATALDEASQQTTQGTGAFQPPVVRSPLDYPYAFVTVWFRPFPNEARAGGATQLASAVENTALAALVLLSWRRLRGLPRAIVRVPYVAFAGTFALVFVYAYSAIGNFGILVRQRTQGLVLLFVVLAIPVLEEPAHRSFAAIREGRIGRVRRRLHLLAREERTARSQ